MPGTAPAPGEQDDPRRVIDMNQIQIAAHRRVDRLAGQQVRGPADLPRTVQARPSGGSSRALAMSLDESTPSASSEARPPSRLGWQGEV